MKKRMGTILLSLIIFFSVISVSGSQSKKIDQLSEELLRLRSEVERLNEEVETSKEIHQNELKALSIQKSELESDLQRQRLTQDQLKSKIVKIKTKLKDEGLGKGEQKQVLTNHIQELRAYISSSLPFQKDMRMEALDKIESSIESETMATEVAFNRLWNFIEDEIRLTKESGLFKQKITTKGGDHLANVIRLGMMALFYRLADGQVGMAQKKQGSWVFIELKSGESKEQIETLFTSFKKQIRSGYFEIPNILSAKSISFDGEV